MTQCCEGVESMQAMMSGAARRVGGGSRAKTGTRPAYPCRNFLAR